MYKNLRNKNVFSFFLKLPVFTVADVSSVLLIFFMLTTEVHSSILAFQCSVLAHCFGVTIVCWFHLCIFWWMQKHLIS